MKNCHVCGAENADYARFCTRCGSPLEETVSARTEEDSDLFGHPPKRRPLRLPPPIPIYLQVPRRRPNVSATATLPLSETEAAPRKAEAPSKNAKESLDEASFAVENITRITPQLFLKFYKWMKILGIVFCILGALALVLYIVSFFTYDEYGNPAPDDSALLAACVLIGLRRYVDYRPCRLYKECKDHRKHQADRPFRRAGHPYLRFRGRQAVFPSAYPLRADHPRAARRRSF